MYLRKLKLENFRSYENLELEFENNINIFFGKNAEGKTNILEAIYISSITKSYRVLKDTECINFKKDYFKIINSYVKSNEKKLEIDIFLDKISKKKIKENDILVKKYSDYLGTIPIVMFCPDDMNIITSGPKEKRRFLDILISQISKKYIITLSEYNKLLQIKNNLLKKEKQYIDNNYLDILDEKIARAIFEICNFRKKYIEIVEKKSKNIQEILSKNTENLKIVYNSDFIQKNIQEIKDILVNNREIDLFRKTSTKGIGRDDIQIYVNDKEISKFGSQGQKRTALLSLKLAEFEILKEKKEETPIILLDDVFSELDIDRIKFLLKYVSKYQVFITTTDIDLIKDIDNKKIFKVKQGIVEKTN